MKLSIAKQRISADFRRKRKGNLLRNCVIGGIFGRNWSDSQDEQGVTNFQGRFWTIFYTF